MDCSSLVMVSALTRPPCGVAGDACTLTSSACHAATPPASPACPPAAGAILHFSSRGASRRLSGCGPGVSGTSAASSAESLAHLHIQPILPDRLGQHLGLDVALADELGEHGQRDRFGVHVEEPAGGRP